MGSVPRRVLKRIHAVVFRDALAVTLYAVFAAAVVGALAGKVVNS